MPASYAHHRFGKQLIPSLPAGERQCIQRFRRMFDVGLHGPDIFFYHNPLMKTATGRLGDQFHGMSGQDFFPTACAAATSEAAQAYLYGLLGHYCLDSLCHPYVQQIVDIGEASHVALESEFERYLLVLDKVPAPHTYDMSARLRLTRGECMTVAAFYPPATGFGVKQSITVMSLVTRLLANPRRKQTEALLNVFDPAFREHMVPPEESEALALYVRELNVLYRQALERYPLLLQQLTEHLKSGTPLGDAFAPTFG